MRGSVPPAHDGVAVPPDPPPDLPPDVLPRALAAWGLDGADVHAVGSSYNTVLRVEHPRGRFALRVGPPVALHEPGVDEAERSFLDHLARREVSVPQVHRTADGAASVTIDGADGPRRCMLLDWLDGDDVVRPVDVRDAQDLGCLAAVLHDAAPRYDTPPPGALDGRRVLPFPLPDRFDEVHDHAAVLRAAEARVRGALATLWGRAGRTAPRLLHGDLTPANVLRAGHGLVPIDFQDLLWGLPAQDVAISLVRLRRDDEADGGARCAAFRTGYESVRRWPLDPADVPHLVAARHLQLVAIGLTLRAPGLEEHLDRHVRPLADYVAAVRASGAPLRRRVRPPAP